MHDVNTPCAPHVAVPEIAACLARRCDLFVFGYGSLMWNPGFRHQGGQPALLRGYHRRFCVYSSGHRGTVEKPGVVLGLDRGGACKGMVFQVSACDADEAMAYLWDREMQGGVYLLRELPVETAQGIIRAQTFVVDYTHSHYTGGLDLEATARCVIQGQGKSGACRDYLENTIRQLELLRLPLGPIEHLARKVRELAEAAEAR